MMCNEPRDRLGGPRRRRKGSFSVSLGPSVEIAKLKVRCQEASGGREEEHSAQRNKEWRPVQLPDEIRSEQCHDGRGRIAAVEDRVSPRVPAHSDHPGNRHARNHEGLGPGERIGLTKIEKHDRQEGVGIAPSTTGLANRPE